MLKNKLIFKIFFLTIIFGGIFGVVAKSWAADFYIAQNASGENTGIDCVNAYAVSWFNSSGNWANPKAIGKVGPGDTVHLCGTIRTALDVQGSGSSGNVITILFDPGAKMSSPIWPNSTGAIRVFLKDYITIDGGANGTIGGYGATGTPNGIIENTANGTGLANSAPSRGIQGINANFFTVKNLWVKNIYNRTSNTDVVDDDSSGISNKAGNGELITGYTVTNCVVDNAYRGVEGDYGVGCSDYNFSYITATRCNWGIGVGDRGAGKTLSGLVAHHIYVHDWTNWDNPGANIYHHNGIFFFSNHDSAIITRPTIYSSVFGPGFGGAYQTGAIYMNTGISTPLVYNNVFLVGANEYVGNGFITLNSTLNTTLHIYNNTFISEGGTSGTAIQLSGNSQLQTINVKNNLFKGSFTAISLYNNSNIRLNSDYNSFYGLSNLGFVYSSNSNGVFKTLAEWGALGFDAHMVTNNPQVISFTNGQLQPDSPNIDSGVSLSSFFATDLIGTSRPQEAAWDIGAYEYFLGEDTTPPSAPTGIRVL